MLSQLGEVRHLAFANKSSQQLRVHAINAKDDELVMAMPTRPTASARHQQHAAEQGDQASQGRTGPLQIIAPSIFKMTDAAVLNQLLDFKYPSHASVNASPFPLVFIYLNAIYLNAIHLNAVWQLVCGCQSEYHSYYIGIGSS
jgi:hypothetical protein